MPIGFNTQGFTPDATASTKGKLKIAGDLGGTADLPTVPGLALLAPLARPTVNITTTAHTLVIANANKNLVWSSTLNTPARTCLVQTNAVVAFPIDTELELSLKGNGATDLYNNLTVSGSVGVSFIAPLGLTCYKNGKIFLKQIEINVWYVYTIPFQMVGNDLLSMNPGNILLGTATNTQNFKIAFPGNKGIDSSGNFHAGFVYANKIEFLVGGGITDGGGTTYFLMRYTSPTDFGFLCKGTIKYLADYSANYTDRDVPDVAFVNSRIRRNDISVDGLTAVDPNVINIDFTALGPTASNDYMVDISALNQDAALLIKDGYWITNKTTSGFNINFISPYITVVNMSWKLNL